MRNGPIYSRLTFCVVATLIVMSLGLIVRETLVINRSIGEVSDKQFQFPLYGKIKVYNAGMGKRIGEFIVFEPVIKSRYPVLIFVGSRKVMESDSAFVGIYCGVIRDRFDAYPCSEPFVLIENAIPVTDN